MQKVWRDDSYTTMLGTAFYDRRDEIARLRRLLESRRTVIVYGPRNVGKSEFVRYFLSRILRGRRGVYTVVIDVRKRAAREYGVTGDVDVKRLVEPLLADAGRVPPSLVNLVENIVDLYQRRRAELVVVYVDEFHLLYSSKREAVRELEKVTGYLAKMGDTKARLLLSVSEGFITLSSVDYRLLGYSTSYMLVEPLDREHMQSLYEEYRAKQGCNISFKLYWRLFGGSPGYLVDVCKLTTEELYNEYIPRMLQQVDRVLDRISDRLHIDKREVLKRTAQLLARPGEHPTPRRLDSTSRKLAEMLVYWNIAYPCRLVGGKVYMPQLPLYSAAIHAAAEVGLDDVSSLPVEELVKRNEVEQQIRCADMDTRRITL